jgi:hypothetical protein
MISFALWPTALYGTGAMSDAVQSDDLDRPLRLRSLALLIAPQAGGPVIKGYTWNTMAKEAGR